MKSRIVIQAVLKSGQRYYSKRLALCYLKDITGLESEYGVAFLLSKRAGNAVERNKIKRWLREDFRALQGSNTRHGAFVIKFRGVAENSTHPQLLQELEKLYNSIKIDG